jgi:lipoprotein-anchoring transpeptidase ErfK/SrfK
MRRAALSLALAVAALVVAAPANGQEPPPPEEPVVADGVTIAGVAVGGLTEAEATAAVQAAFDRRLTLLLRRRTLSVSPATLGARARVYRAVQAALVAAPSTAVPLEVWGYRWKLRRWLNALADRFNRRPRSSRMVLRDLRPWITAAKRGRALRRLQARQAVKYALVHHVRAPVRLRTRHIRPKVNRWNIGRAIVIRRDSKRLFLYRPVGRPRMKLMRVFGVATGMAAYPTPLGRFWIAVKERNPWWNPPDADWAAGAEPIPPGPGNPLGTRWMGLSVGGVGIHGTPDAASIGYSASHGCIRMLIPQAEWLFERVVVGTPVFIVGA